MASVILAFLIVATIMVVSTMIIGFAVVCKTIRDSGSHNYHPDDWKEID